MVRKMRLKDNHDLEVRSSSEMNAPDVVRPSESESSTGKKEDLQPKPQPKRAPAILWLLLLLVPEVAWATTNDEAWITHFAIIAMAGTSYPSASSDGDAHQGSSVL